MSTSESPETVDICLLLRAHGEQLWMQSRVLPLVCKLERRGTAPEGRGQLSEEQLGAALAYLEVVWIEARRRAAVSDAALARVQPQPGSATGTLREQARRYHAAVRRLRRSLGQRVTMLLAVPDDRSPVEQASR
jgi:hypothetical protein